MAKITAKFNDWVEVPLLVGTIQPLRGIIEIETSVAKPTVLGEGVRIKRGEKQSFNSTVKVWVRAIGTENVVCNYGGF